MYLDTEIHINDSIYVGNATLIGDRSIKLNIPIELSRIVEFGDEVTITINTDVFRTQKLESIGSSAKGWSIIYLLRSEEQELAEELSYMRINLAKSNSQLDSIRNAIKDLDGLPTLTKFTSFLANIKEILHYDE